MGLTQVNTSYYLGQSYHMGRNISTESFDRMKGRDLPHEWMVALKEEAGLLWNFLP